MMVVCHLHAQTKLHASHLLVITLVYVLLDLMELVVNLKLIIAPHFLATTVVHVLLLLILHFALVPLVLPEISVSSNQTAQWLVKMVVFATRNEMVVFVLLDGPALFATYPQIRVPHLLV